MDLKNYQKKDRLTKVFKDMNNVVNNMITERDKFKDMYLFVHNDYSLIKNLLDHQDKKNQESNKQLNLYKEMNLTMENDVREIMLNFDDNKKTNISNIGLDILSKKSIEFLRY